MSNSIFLFIIGINKTTFFFPLTTHPNFHTCVSFKQKVWSKITFTYFRVSADRFTFITLFLWAYSNVQFSFFVHTKLKNWYQNIFLVWLHKLWYWFYHNNVKIYFKVFQSCSAVLESGFELEQILSQFCDQLAAKEEKVIAKIFKCMLFNLFKCCQKLVNHFFQKVENTFE